MSESLTSNEQAALQYCEERISSGIARFKDVGLALTSIRDKRLYRSSHKSFESYLKDRWQMGRSYAYQLIESSAVAEEVSAIADIKTESQARELAKVEPEHRAEVLDEVAAAGPVTAKAIKKAASKRISMDDDDSAHSESVVLSEDSDSRAYRVSLKLQALAESAKEAIGTLNPTRAELVQAAMTFKKLAADLDRAAEKLTE